MLLVNVVGYGNGSPQPQNTKGVGARAPIGGTKASNGGAKAPNGGKHSLLKTEIV